MSAFTVKTRKISTIIQLITNGNMQIPKFQRQYVWEREHIISLLESIIDGEYVGNIIIHETEAKEDNLNKFGDYVISSSSQQIIEYIVDGHQRLATIFSVFQNLLPLKTNYRYYIDFSHEIDMPRICYIHTKSKQFDHKKHLPLSCFFEDSDFNQCKMLLDVSYVKQAEEMRNHLLLYEVPFMIFKSDSIEDIQNLFFDLNARGKKLTNSDLFKAKNYRELNLLVDQVIDRFSLNENRSYMKLQSDQNFLRDCIIGYIYETLDFKDMLELPPQSYSIYLDEIYNGLCSAMDFLIKQLHVVDFQFLPHPYMIIPLVYFFGSGKKKGKTCDNYNQTRFIKSWFWSRSFSLSYNNNYRKLVKKDILNFKYIMNNQYHLVNINNTVAPDFFLDNKKGENSATRVFILLLMSHKPLSFLSGTRVDYIRTFSRANSSIAHHVYPYRSLEIMKYSYHRINALVNLAIINEQDNDAIKDKMPSTYGHMMDENNRNKILDSALCPVDILKPEYTYDQFEKSRSEILADYANQLIKGDIEFG